ncbi:MAG: hypothetical protein BGP24_07435 [Lysobacterales bacterium 69-70]|nr:MAG: hypothetical protein ABT27_17510 [Xanthomonadaceae bacterium SCN 69-25]OJY97802.1 MAG: hypothetical protein BGP24_07435 [Xanthomonadales bacterium 69-70]
MMMKNKLLFLAMALFGSSAGAAEIRCDDCSESAYMAQALTRGSGTHYVYDLVKGYARKFEVTRSCEEGMVCFVEAESLSVERDVINVVGELAAYYAATQGTMKSLFVVTTNGPVQNLSAYDVAGPGGARTQLIDWLAGSASISWSNALPMGGAAVHSLVLAAVSIFKSNIGQTLITVQFADGSKITFEYNPVNNSLTAVENSAVDAHGNIIPVTPSQLNGVQYNYGSEGPNGPAGTRMRNYLYTMFGVPVVYGAVRWSCWTETDRVVCRPY